MILQNTLRSENSDVFANSEVLGMIIPEDAVVVGIGSSANQILTGQSNNSFCAHIEYDSYRQEDYDLQIPTFESRYTYITNLARDKGIDLPEIPDKYKCPISAKLIEQPIILPENQHAYDKSYLEEWLGEHNSTDPLTRRKLGVNGVVTLDNTFKAEIDIYLTILNTSLQKGLPIQEELEKIPQKLQELQGRECLTPNQTFYYHGLNQSEVFSLREKELTIDLERTPGTVMIFFSAEQLAPHRREAALF